MPVAPFALRKLIAPGANDPRITATQVILHVAVSESSSLFDYFNGPSGGVESHFYIRRDGTVEQYRDTDYEADANYTANARAISIETQGMGDGEWTPQQLDSIKRLLTWARDEHNIPLRPCPAHDQPGVGYHVMFGAPGPWTPVAKSCPGPDRVRQFNNALVPWMRGNEAQEDDMPTPEEFWNYPVPQHDGKGWNSEQAAKWAVAQGRHAARRALEAIGEVAQVLGNTKFSDAEKADLVDQIAKRTAAEVDRLDAEAVASRLEITTKE